VNEPSISETRKVELITEVVEKNIGAPLSSSDRKTIGMFNPQLPNALRKQIIPTPTDKEVI